MAPKSGLFQASFSAALLRSAALAIVLIVQAPLARAEVVTLVCKNESGSLGTADSFMLRVDYDRKTIDMLRSDGTAQYSAAATITEGVVEWGNRKDYGIFRGELNRLSGQGFVAFPVKGMSTGEGSMSGPCRRATQKF